MGLGAAGYGLDFKGLRDIAISDWRSELETSDPYAVFKPEQDNGTSVEFVSAGEI